MEKHDAEHDRSHSPDTRPHGIGGTDGQRMHGLCKRESPLPTDTTPYPQPLSSYPDRMRNPTQKVRQQSEETNP